MTPFYDPMIAKIIACGRGPRGGPRAAGARPGRHRACVGVATNLGFLARIVADPDFAAGAVDTGFIERRREALLAPPGRCPPIALAAAALDRLLSREAAARGGRCGQTRGRGATAGGSISRRRRRISLFRCGDDGIRGSGDRAAGRSGWRLATAPTASMSARGRARWPDGMLAVVLDGVRRARAGPRRTAPRLAVFLDGESWLLEMVDPLAPPAGADVPAGRLTAPMPGRVVQLLVAAGDAVRQGQPMMVVEAMKMEHTIAAPRDGTVAAVHYAPGDLVEEGAELIALAEPDDARRLTMSADANAPAPLHLLKMAVGVADVDELRRVRAARIAQHGGSWVYTRNQPRRAEAVLARRLALLGDPRPDPGAPADHRVPQRARREGPRAYCLIEVEPVLVRDALAAVAAVPGLALSDARRRAAGRAGTAGRDAEARRRALPERMMAELRALGLL